MNRPGRLIRTGEPNATIVTATGTRTWKGRIRKLPLLTFLLLGACTRAMNFTPTMASDPPHLGIEGIALATELSRAYERAPDDGICNNLELGFQEARRHSVSRYNSGGSDAADLFRCVGFRQFEEPAERREAVTHHVQAGLALSDYFCSNFFERIAEHAAKRRFGRSTTNDVGAMVSAVLGLAAAGSGLTGGVGAGFGLLDAVWRNYDDSFLVDADLPTLQGLVLSEQARFRRDLEQPDKQPDNFPDATNVILRYANLCSFVGMRRLLTASMRDRTDSNVTASGDPSVVRQRAREFMDADRAAQERQLVPDPEEEAPADANNAEAGPQP